MTDSAARVVVAHPDREPTEAELDAITDELLDRLLGPDPQ